MLVVAFAISGCASTESTRSHEPNPLAVAAAVTGGAIVGAVAFPIAYPVAVIAGERRKEEAEANRALLDPIYEKRMAEIRSRDPVADAERVFQSDGIVLIPAFPDTDYYAGFTRESPSLPDFRSNSEAIRHSKLMKELIVLTSDDERHPKGEKSINYFSPVYVAFRGAAWPYKCSFNRAMVERLKTKTSNQPPEPTR